MTFEYNKKHKKKNVSSVILLPNLLSLFLVFSSVFTCKNTYFSFKYNFAFYSCNNHGLNIMYIYFKKWNFDHTFILISFSAVVYIELLIIIL